MKIHFLLLIGLIILASGCTAQQQQQQGDVNMGNRVAKFETNMGTFKVELFEDNAPITTKNFIDLASSGFYDGLVFHRIIDGFMIQGGDPNGDGTGGKTAEYHEGFGDPDDPETWTIPDEFDPNLRHQSEGIISMANRGPDTGSSQFFITLAPTPWLDGRHTVFGKVVEGVEAVRAIGKVQTDAGDRPVDPVVINRITIEGQN